MRDRVLIIIFSIFIAFGLLCGLLYSLNFNLNSDTVVPGLVAMEIFNHGNLQYTYPVDDPYLFTDIYPFYLVPQVLSGYDPTVLRLTAFFIFVLTVLVFAYIVYRYAGTVSALIFAALFVNIGPPAYNCFIPPEYHVGTLLAAGILLYIFDFDRVKNISRNRLLVYIVFLSLILLSDSLLLAMFIIPYVACYILYFRNEFNKSRLKKKGDKQATKGAWSLKDIKNLDIMMAAIVVASAVVWLFKTFEPAFLYQLIYFNPKHTGISGIYQILTVNLPLYFRSLAILVNQGLYNVLNLQIGLLDIPAAIIFLAALGYSIVKRKDGVRYLYLMFLFAAITVFLGFIILDRTGDIWSARFLNFTAVSIFIMLALAYDNKTVKPAINLIFIAAIVLLILSTVPANLHKVMSLDYQPNKADYELIDYLKANNITQAYSEFDDSNKLTYLSKESVEVRYVTIENGQIKLFIYTWLGSSRWYSHGIFATPVFIVNKNNAFNDDLQAIFKQVKPVKTLDHNDYLIYVMPPT